MMEDCAVEATNASGAAFTGEDAVVRRCVFRDNGQLGFGASHAHRLQFTDCLVENNNTKGFSRGWEAGGDKLALCRDVVLERSRFVRNRDAQVWGWFDVKDPRHWPAGSTSSNQTAAAITKPGDIAEAYIAGSNQGQPQDLTLEKLRLNFEHNVYYARPGGAWFKWGPTWALHQSYADLQEFQSELGIDTGSQVLDPGFADPRQMDFRVREETMTRLKESYPAGPVPGVMLGVIGD